MARPSDQALVASDQANLRCPDPSGFDPSRMWFRGFAVEGLIEQARAWPGNGSIDALSATHVSALLNTLADALEAIATEARRAETAQTGSAEDEGAGRQASPKAQP